LVEYKLYVEGGGTGKHLRTECRAGFSAFLEKAALSGTMPRIVACGSRGEAYEKFRLAVGQGQKAFLLVDSESPVDAEHAVGEPEIWKPWGHLRRQTGDGWSKPASTSDTDCHLMVQVMESWFLADKETLSVFFGQGFRFGALPSQDKVEHVAKDALYRGLASASRSCKTKACYGKGSHSFKILALLDPTKVCAASPWAKRFIDTLKIRATMFPILGN
jgi:hypothetical protein